MQVIGRNEQMAIDRLWQKRTGLPLLLLMESAAGAVTRICLDLLSTVEPSAGEILILAGKGNNGGDAYACARQLAAFKKNVICRDVFPQEPLTPDAALNRSAAKALGIDLGPLGPDDFTGLSSGSLIVDGIFGTGYRADRPLPSEVAAISGKVASARRLGARVVAIDVPTGLDADSGAVDPSAIQADFTVTFVRPKIGLCAAPGRFFAGRVITDNIGITDSLANEAIQEVSEEMHRPAFCLIELADVAACRPKRPADSHKGLFGKVLLLGGAPGMPGAILLAAEAAARSGAGLSYLGVPEAIGSLVLAARPESLLTLLDNESADADGRAIQNLLAGNPAVAAGPGSGKAGWLALLLALLIRDASRLVLDADALNLIADDKDFYFPLLRERLNRAGQEPAILTPHPGEFHRLAPDLDLSDRQMAALELAKRSGCIIILKGASSVIAEKTGNIWINPTGHDGLARGGSGDVLCGLVAGLLAQGLPAASAALCGVYLHGLAAELAAGRLSRRSMLPGDVIASIGDAFRKVGWE